MRVLNTLRIILLVSLICVCVSDEPEEKPPVSQRACFRQDGSPKYCDPDHVCAIMKENFESVGCVNTEYCYPEDIKEEDKKPFNAEMDCDQPQDKCCCDADFCNTRANACKDERFKKNDTLCNPTTPRPHEETDNALVAENSSGTALTPFIVSMFFVLFAGASLCLLDAVYT